MKGQIKRFFRRLCDFFFADAPDEDADETHAKTRYQEK